jgi:tetratricopeptide (TPR) repeat protein
MTRVIKIAGPLIFALLWACWPLSSALAQVEIDLGPQEVPSLEAEEPEAILGLAAQQMNRGEAAVALATIAQGLARHPDDPSLLERQADIYATLPFMWPRAADLYRRLLVQRPGDLALKNKLASLYLALGQIAQAERLFQKVLAAKPDNVEAHLGLGRLYLRSAFYTMAQYHFERALNKMPDSQGAREGLKQTQGLITPQLQALAGYFEDSAGFRRNFLYSGYRLYLNPRLRLYGGYGYLSYSSGPALFPKSNLGRALHRHVLPLILQYRPVRTLFLELGGAFNDYARWGQSGTGRAGVYWQATPGTGLSLAYSYYDVIDFLGPFRGPWGLVFDDFSSYGRYRYAITNPIGLWSQTFFGAVAANTVAVTEKIRAHEGSFWGYQALGERIILSAGGIFSTYNDGNQRIILQPTIQFRVLQDPLLKIKYSFAYGNYSHSAADLALAGTAPLGQLGSRSGGQLGSRSGGQLRSRSGGLLTRAVSAGLASPYVDFHALKYHACGAVFEKNWGSRAKLVLESNFVCSREESDPYVKGVNALVEINYLLTYHLSLRAVGFYYYAAGLGSIYQVRSVSGGLSYRF